MKTRELHHVTCTIKKLPALKRDVKNEEGHEQTQNISIGVVLLTPQDKKKVSVKETVPDSTSQNDSEYV